MNVGAFAVITQISGYNEHTRTIEDFTGAALRRPWLGGLFAFFLLSLIGIPFTGGFFGKFYVFAAVIQGGHWLLAVVGLLNSGLACFYYLRLLVAMYARHPHERGNDLAVFTKLPVPAAVGLAAAALGTLLLGVMPGRVLTLANRGAGAVMIASPADRRCSAGCSTEHSALSLPATKINPTAQNETASAQCGGRLYCMLGTMRLAGADEEQHEGEQGERLDEGQAENQEELDAGAGAGVAGQRLRGRRGGAALAKAAESGGDAHADADGERAVGVAGAGAAAPWAKAGVAKQSAANVMKKYFENWYMRAIIGLLAPVRMFAASGWLMLTGLAPSR